MRFDCAGKMLDLSSPQVMGVLNVTPDSFSDGGDFFSLEKAVEHALEMQEEGAAIIDIGGESTRPGAIPVSLEDELSRVIPVIEALQPHLRIPISIDTSKAEVMMAAARAGAGFINDINALRGKYALESALKTGLPVCLMHMQGKPCSMQKKPDYQRVVDEVYNFLQERVDVCIQAGIARSRLLLDPGFGFGKAVEHNVQLLAGLERFSAAGIPLLVGLSRKSMIGALLGLEAADRLPAGIALAVLAVERGARLVRTHDVAATCQALLIREAVAKTMTCITK